MQVTFAKSVIENSTSEAIRMDPEVSRLMHKLRDVNNREIINLEVPREDEETYPVAIENVMNHFADLIEENMQVKELRFVSRHYGTIDMMMKKYKGTKDEGFVRYIMGTGPEIYDFNEEMIYEVARQKEEAGEKSNVSHERKMALEFGAEYLSGLSDFEFINLLIAQGELTDEQLKSLSRTYKEIGREGLIREQYQPEQWKEITKAQAEAIAEMEEEVR
ncbi:MAG: hypothetical protein HFJ50_05765 [Clostridia bacterium]|nr:hypothetical protein [Clostridia bacterium]